MKYSISCPLCQQSVIVDAETDEQALDKIVKEGEIHAKEVHPKMQPMPEQLMRKLVQAGMKKKE